jgi:antitoxin component YwqK of YwqJK toxin-antitoxin module
VTARVQYSVGKAVVGYRDFDADGELTRDSGLRDGRPHGTAYRLDTPGILLSATPYRNGVEHGIARQWSDDGRLIGSYRMRHGTGLDLWWGETWTKPRRDYLAEVHSMLEGQPHGFEWWLDEDERSVFKERHWVNGILHGIERWWAGGTLRRGFPRFHVRGQRVTRRAYERARQTDPSLPLFRPEDDQPRRDFPSAVARRLLRGGGQ